MRRFMFLASVVLGFSASLATLTAQDDGFQPLFDGKTLESFTQKGGQAKFRVENGEIVGTSVPNTENSFLCTNKEYGDFILELEFKVDPQLNSGVQIRSHAYDQPREVETKKGKKRTFPAGRVHGYQVEIDPSPRSYTGAIYDEARRAVFLADLANNEPARKAFKQGEWNKFRIECRGASIQTWINDAPAVSIQDDMTAKGFIALQVHGVGGREEPLEVRWRNLRIKELGGK
jgi:hypothetical protein